MSGFWTFVYCFGKGKMTIWGGLIASAPVVLRNLAEQLNLTGFPDQAAMIVSLVGVVVLLAGLTRKAAGLFVNPETKCE